MYTLNDVKNTDGICWRFVEETAPDCKPTVNSMKDPDQPRGWDWFDPREAGCEYTKTHGKRPVQIVERFKNRTDSEVRPLTTFQIVRTHEVEPGQWYLGIWDSINDAEDCCDDVTSRGWVQKGSYRSGHGPIRDRGYAVVLRKKQQPLEPVVLSCIDPFKDLDDALFVLLKMHVDTLTGEECLKRYELGMQTESIAWNGMGYVCTNAECGLTVAQIEHARMCWEASLKLRVARTRLAAAERERMRVVVDYDVE